MKNPVLSRGAILVGAMMFVNIMNLAFNVFLGRSLSTVEFGNFIVINTILFIFTLTLGALSSLMSAYTARLDASEGNSNGTSFFFDIRRKVLTLAAVITALYLLFIPTLTQFLRLGNYIMLLSLVPVILTLALSSLQQGFFKGRLLFHFVAANLIVESVTKLLSTYLFEKFGLIQYSYLSLPISVFVSCCFGFTLVHSLNLDTKRGKSYEFPLQFYIASVISALSTTAFLSFDVLLVKHFVSPVLAGQYSLMALVGKSIYFLGSLLNTFVIALVSRAEGMKKDTRQTFFPLFAGIAATVFLSVLGIALLGNSLIPLIYGLHTIPILGYMFPYSIAIGLFTIATTLISYHLAKHDFEYTLVSLFSAAAMACGIILFHKNLVDIINVLETVAAINLFVVVYMHFTEQEKVSEKIFTNKRILIFNWRDTKHAFAGGAEVYIMELAKRWVKQGNAVTVFCGNDKKNPGKETYEGVEIIRKGGFFLVYVYAFLYYLFVFRGKYDVVIDCENGIPFFTPLYVREPIYCLMFHVHQEVFRKTLFMPLATVAMYLERGLMPHIYRNIPFLTISESSKNDIAELGLGAAGIEIIHPGINFEIFKPGKKSRTPFILYVGRLKYYKSIEVLIAATQIIRIAIPNIKIGIVGDGDERRHLLGLVDKLKLNDCISFYGRLSEEDKVKLYQKAWVFINPSTIEGWGLTTIEANACATPTVASRVSGLRDSVADGVTGFLAAYGQPHDFAEKITRIIKDEDLRLSMNLKSLIWSRKFDWEKSAQNAINIFHRDLIYRNDFKPASIWRLAYGRFVAYATSYFSSSHFAPPPQIGNYKLLKPVVKEVARHNVALGIYREGEEKYVIKTWRGETKDINYYFMMNEYFIHNTIYYKLIGNPDKKFSIPKPVEIIYNGNTVSLVYEYIDGKPLTDFDTAFQATIIGNVLDGFKTLSSQLSPSERQIFGQRSALSGTIVISLVSIRLFFSRIMKSGLLFTSLMRSIGNILSLSSEPLELAHRDLSLENVIVKDGVPYLLDFETAAYTLPGYDLVFFYLDPSSRNVIDKLTTRLDPHRIRLLQNFIALHQVVENEEPERKEQYLKYIL